VVAANPQAFWPLNETSGSVVNDQVAEADGSYSSSGVSLGQGGAPGDASSSSVAFDGVSGSASVPLNASGDHTLSVEFWMKWNSYADDDHLAMELTSNYNTSNGGFLIDPDSTVSGGGKFEISLRGNAGYTVATMPRPTAGTWHQYVIVFDKTAPANNQITAYVDGQAQPLTMVTAAANTNTFASDDLYLMSRNNTTLFGAGNLQDLAIYPLALTASQIAVQAAI
jgi:hypothetical protein